MSTPFPPPVGGRYLFVEPLTPPPPVHQRTSGFAVAALVLGLTMWFGVGSILAIVFGEKALGEMAADPTVKGRGMALAGVILGWVGVGILVILIAAAVVGG